MPVIEKNTKISAEEDGIWLDYRKNTWLFLIRDKVWQKEEVQRTEKSAVKISFIQKGISDAFLLEIYDCLEPSDIPFCIKDADQEVLDSLKTKDTYTFEIVLVSEDNVVRGIRQGTFSAKNSALLKEKLTGRLSQDFTSEDADHSYAKLEQKYEPYELEQFAVFSEEAG